METALLARIPVAPVRPLHPRALLARSTLSSMETRVSALRTSSWTQTETALPNPATQVVPPATDRPRTNACPAKISQA